MLLRLICCFAIVLFGYYAATSETPEVVEFRKMVFVVVGLTPGEMKSAEDTRSNLERLKARSATAAAPCVMQDRCQVQGGVQGLANSISSDIERETVKGTFGPKQLKPLFIQVEPKR